MASFPNYPLSTKAIHSHGVDTVSACAYDDRMSATATESQPTPTIQKKKDPIVIYPLTPEDRKTIIDAATAATPPGKKTSVSSFIMTTMLESIAAKK